VAVGLETAHPDVLERLNKRMTLDAFRRAASFVREHDIDLRVFVLLSPPFMPAAGALEWACRSIDVAAECGATACTVIPTRGGNGAMEALGDRFAPPRLADLEAAVEYGIASTGPGRASGAGGGPPVGRVLRTRQEASEQSDMRVFADLWNVERFFGCACAAARVERLRVMNREQRVPPRVVCACDDRH
jgi:hypothetical protein